MQKPFNKPGTPSLAPRRNTALSAARETKFYSEHSALLISKMSKMNRTDMITKIVNTTPSVLHATEKGIPAFQIKLSPSLLKVTII